MRVRVRVVHAYECAAALYHGVGGWKKLRIKGCVVATMMKNCKTLKKGGGWE